MRSVGRIRTVKSDPVPSSSPVNRDPKALLPLKAVPSVTSTSSGLNPKIPGALHPPAWPPELVVHILAAFPAVAHTFSSAAPSSRGGANLPSVNSSSLSAMQQETNGWKHSVYWLSKNLTGRWVCLCIWGDSKISRAREEDYCESVGGTSVKSLQALFL